MDEKLIYELIFILATEIPKEDFPALTGRRSTARVELLGGERPNLHAMSGTLTAFIGVFSEPPGQAGFSRGAIAGEHHLGRGLEDLRRSGGIAAAAGVQMIIVSAAVSQPSRVEPNEMPAAVW